MPNDPQPRPQPTPPPEPPKPPKPEGPDDDEARPSAYQMHQEAMRRMTAEDRRMCLC